MIDAPPSTKFVHRELTAADQPLTRSELADRTTLPGRTCRRALATLCDRGLAERTRRCGDARKIEYGAVESSGHIGETPERLSPHQPSIRHAARVLASRAPTA